MSFANDQKYFFIEACFVRDREFHTSLLQDLFEISRSRASVILNEYLDSATGIFYDASKKRFIATSKFKPVMMTKKDAMLYADLIDMFKLMHDDSKSVIDRSRDNRNKLYKKTEHCE